MEPAHLCILAVSISNTLRLLLQYFQSQEMPCRDAPDVPHAQAEGSVKTNYEPGETVRYQCHPGFVAVGSQEVTCKRGQWTQLPECQDVTCGDPPAVANAEIIDHRHRRYWPAERVQYQCHEGFESHGPNDVTCINREWSQPPTCEDMTCGPPPAVTNGQILEYGNQRYLPGERVRYRCQQGLSLIGSQTVTCQKQKWSEPPECRELRSKRQNAKTFQKMSEPMRDRGYSRDATQCSVKLKELRQGYQKTKESNGRSGTEPQTCRFYVELHAILVGAATTTPPLSVDSDDGVLSAMPEDFVDREDELEESTQHTVLPYSQDLFITLTEIPSQHNQAREGTSDVTCGAPPEVTNATIVTNEEGRYLPGARVQYKCQEGFESMGLNDVTCEDGEWSQPPTCQDLSFDPKKAFTLVPVVQRFDLPTFLRSKCETEHADTAPDLSPQEHAGGDFSLFTF
ncbi:Complement factor H [Chelonia mydas]|uniref:Complement factor H n=1 Tax=Chelonia mydas TaxID=8469 RepID=M7BTR7_CHEMY|nr:Complement factor H [Chelonia mydas]